MCGGFSYTVGIQSRCFKKKPVSALAQLGGRGTFSSLRDLIVSAIICFPLWEQTFMYHQ